ARQRNTWGASPWSARATELTDLVTWPDSRQQKPSRLPGETAKQRLCSGLRAQFHRPKENLAKLLQQDYLALSAANRVRLQALLRQRSSRVKANLLKAADWPPLPRLRRPRRPPLLVARDLRCRWAKGFPLPLVRARRRWQGPGPCASCPAKQGVRK